MPAWTRLKEYHQRIKAEGVQIDPSSATATLRDVISSIPEGNRIELYCKTGFDVPQPHGDLIDLEASNEELIAFAQAAIPAN